MRVVLAVITGYLIFAISSALLFQFSGHDPRVMPGLAFGVFSVAWGMAFAGLGGYLAPRIAKRATWMPGVLVGCVIAVGAIVSLCFEAGKGSIWSQVAAIVLMAPAAGFGGRLAASSGKQH